MCTEKALEVSGEVQITCLLHGFWFRDCRFEGQARKLLAPNTVVCVGWYCFAIFTVAVLKGCEKATSTCFSALPRLQESSSECKWGQSPSFWPAHHPIQQPLLKAVMLVETGKEHFWGDAWEIRIVCYICCLGRSENENRRDLPPAGQAPGSAGLPTLTPSCTLCIMQKCSRDRVLTARSRLEAPRSDVIQHSTSALV